MRTQEESDEESRSDDSEVPIPAGFHNNIPNPFANQKGEPADNAAMRVTWTELARRNTRKLNPEDIANLNDSREQGVRF